MFPSQLLPIVKWGASSWWSSSQCYLMRSLDKMTTGNTHSTLLQTFSFGNHHRLTISALGGHKKFSRICMCQVALKSFQLWTLTVNKRQIKMALCDLNLSIRAPLYLQKGFYTFTFVFYSCFFPNKERKNGIGNITFYIIWWHSKSSCKFSRLIVTRVSIGQA